MKCSPNVVAGVVVFNTDLETLRSSLKSLICSSIRVDVVCLCNSPSLTYQSAVKELCENLGVLCLSNQPNRGFGAGHNVMWQGANSEWYVCCNPDVKVESRCIEKLLEFADSKLDAMLLMPKIINVDGSVQHLARRHPTFGRWLLRQCWRILPKLVKPYEVKFDYSQSQLVEFVSGCFFATRIDVLKKLNGFDESFFLYGEDADLSKRACAQGQNWFVADALVQHVWAAEWKTNFKAFIRNLNGLINYWRKHGLF